MSSVTRLLLSTVFMTILIRSIDLRSIKNARGRFTVKTAAKKAEKTPIVERRSNDENFRSSANSPAENLTYNTDETGSVFFGELIIFGEFYVDKTLLIREFLRLKSRSIIVTRPKRWGKTVNTDMLKTFFQSDYISNNNNNKPLLRSKKKSSSSARSYFDMTSDVRRRLFTGGPVVIAKDVTKNAKRTRISYDAETMKLQGTRPVIYLTFAGFVGTSRTELENELKTEIRDLFSEHVYLERTLACEEERSRFRAYRSNDNKKKKQIIDRSELEKSLSFLSRLLNRYYRMKVYVFIDDYDVPMRNLLNFCNEANADKFPFYDYDDDDFRDLIEDEGDVELTIELFRNFFRESLANNSNLEKALITGIFPNIIDGDVLGPISKRDDVTICSLLSSVDDCRGLSEYYGFTDSEVRNLLSSEKPDNNVTIYGRYKYVLINGLTIYNPWSISRYRKERIADNYWSEKSFLPDEILTSDRSQTDVRNLIVGRSISSNRITDNVCSLSNNNNNSNSNNDNYNELSILLHAGYLTAIRLDNDTLSIMIPNNETLSFYERKLRDWLDGKRIVTYNDGWLIDNRNPIIDLLLTGNIDDRFDRLEKRLNYVVFERLFPPPERPSHDNDVRLVDGLRRFYYVVCKYLLQSYETEFDNDDIENTATIVLRSLDRYDRDAVVKIETTRVNDNDNDLKKIAELTMETIDERLYSDRKPLTKACFLFNDKTLRLAARDFR